MTPIEPNDELKKIEADEDALVAAGFATRQEARDSSEWAARVMGIPLRECPHCGAEISRNQRRCGCCECSL